MSALDWLQTLLMRQFPDAEVPLSQLNLPDNDVQAWGVLAQCLDLSDDALLEYLRTETAVPVADINPESRNFIPIKESVARRFKVVAFAQQGNTLHLACTRPLDEMLKRELAFCLGQRVELFLAAPETLSNLLNLIYSLQESDSRSMWIDDQVLAEAVGPEAAIERICMLLLDEAVAKKASDLHIQSFLGGGLVRFRVDGQLIRGSSLPRKVQTEVIRFLMTRAHLDTSNHSTPQDGRIRITIRERIFDLRISVLPSHEDTRLVIRFLDQSREFTLAGLGFPLAEQHKLERLCMESRGLILFTGPTGSGKTTSLYSLLSGLNTPDRNIMTAEDPVEYRLAGISQIEVDDKRGRTFQAILKSMLRQDPDIILIGEIRDAETLKIAMQAVMTGHLVFATLHTSDIPGTVRRLMDLDVTQGQLAEGLKGVIAQRMARKLCSCAEAIGELSHLEQLFADTAKEKPAKRAVGCETCNFTGYSGRFPLVEVYEPDQEDRNKLRTESFLLDAPPALRRSMAVIAADAVVSGVTSVEEITKVLGADFWRQFNELAVTEALSHCGTGLSASASASLLVIGMPDALLEQIRDASTYPIVNVADAPAASKLLRTNSNVFAQIVYLSSDADRLQQLSELRHSLSWAGLPTAFLVEDANESTELLFSQQNVSNWLAMPVEISQLKQLCSQLLQDS